MRLSALIAGSIFLLASTIPAHAATIPAPTDPAGPAGPAGDAVEAPAPSAADRLHLGIGQSLLLAPTADRLEVPAERQPANGADAPAAAAMQTDRRGGLTWVLVGASLLAAGLIIEGNAGAALSVGGALLGAYGVYLLVRS